MTTNEQGHIIVDSQETPETRDGVAIVFNQETLKNVANKIKNKEISEFELTGSEGIRQDQASDIVKGIRLNYEIFMEATPYEHHYELRSFEP